MHRELQLQHCWSSILIYVSKYLNGDRQENRRNEYRPFFTNDPLSKLVY